MKVLLIYLLVFGSLALWFFGMISPALIISGGRREEFAFAVQNLSLPTPYIGFIMSIIGLGLLGKRKQTVAAFAGIMGVVLHGWVVIPQFLPW